MAEDCPSTRQVLFWGAIGTSALALSLRALGHVDWPWGLCALAGPAGLSAAGASVFAGWCATRMTQALLELRWDEYVGITALGTVNGAVFFGIATWMLTPHLGVPSGVLVWVWTLPASAIVGCFLGTISVVGLGGFIAGRVHKFEALPGYERRRWRSITLRLTTAVYAGALGLEASTRVHGLEWLWAAPAALIVAVAAAMPTMSAVVACEKKAWRGLAIGAIMMAAFAFVLAQIASVGSGDADRITALPTLAIASGVGLGAFALLARRARDLHRSLTEGRES